jgi:acetyl-CoA acetyltransferase
MREAVICEPVRTAVGSYGGMFKPLTAVQLGVAALEVPLERAGLDPELAEDVILGHCYLNVIVADGAESMNNVAFYSTTCAGEVRGAG